MDKATTHEVLSYYNGNSPSHIVVNKADDLRVLRDYARRMGNIFPSIVKPVDTGSSVGVGQNSVVYNLAELESVVNRIITEYDQAVIIEDFLAGKEYGIGILGNLVLPIIEFDLEKVPGNPKVRDPFVKEINHKSYAKPLEFGDGATRQSYLFMAAQAAIVHTALGCNDYSRSDFRQSKKDGKNYFIEVNPLPGLDPKLSDFVSICEFAGIDYDSAVNAILWEAVKRYQGYPEYAERFHESRVGYIREFISPAIESLEMHAEIVPRGNRLVPEIASVPYQLVKAKIHK
jgi:D-alanine-D-alanine ligase